jgi:tetratricopeptide (TPR) repeat protein
MINAAVGDYFSFIGKHDKAIEQYQKTLEMDPNFEPAHYYLARAYRDKGMYEEALQEYKLLNYLSGMGISYAKMGKTAEAKKVLNELMERAKHMFVSRYSLANIYFALGDNDQGFAWLERAYEDREHGLCWLKVNYSLNDSVRSDQRFKALLKKMGLDK